MSDVCPRCGLIRRKSRKGSLTAWVFGESTCICSNKTADILKTLRRDSPKPLDQQQFPKLGRKYRVLELIGQGGMGDIYKILETDTNKVLAAKVLQKEFLNDSKAIRRFKQEAMNASRLQHRNVVNVYGYSQTDDNLLYLVMDCVDGVSLEHVINSCDRMRWSDAMSIFFQLSRALSYAHASSIIHRDLKPSNIMLCQDESGFEQVKVLDLGISKVMSSSELDADKKLTQTGEIFGSPLYMSPEQCQGESVDVRADIYSLGCVMYEILTGEPPFDAENSVKIILKHISAPREELYSKLEYCEVPANLQRIIVDGCLSISPDDRFDRIEDLISQLNSFSEKPFDNSKIVKRSIVVSLSVIFVVSILGAIWYLIPSVVSFLDGKSQSPRQASGVKPDHSSSVKEDPTYLNSLQNKKANPVPLTKDQKSIESAKLPKVVQSKANSSVKLGDEMETNKEKPVSTNKVRIKVPKEARSDRPPQKSLSKPVRKARSVPKTEPKSQNDRWSSFRKQYKGE